ncbi:uncharacterized protein LOC113352749 [Papaver somniferum]|uniref:uncharacterized protein LOC113352749 n=1 Tax=Papaver somniferum TaxID=3469 RepID=UPI000E6F6649|nr:uncharacterized protein LOC113352749 [Papaver somniferum]
MWEVRRGLRRKKVGLIMGEKKVDHSDVSGEVNDEHVKKGKGKKNKRKNENGGDSGESCIEKSDGEAESGSCSSKKRNREEEVLDVDIGEGKKKKKKKKKGSKLDAHIENINANVGDVETENNFGSANEHLRNSYSKKSSKRVKFANHVEVFPASDDQDEQEENPGTELIREFYVPLLWTCGESGDAHRTHIVLLAIRVTHTTKVEHVPPHIHVFSQLICNRFKWCDESMVPLSELGIYNLKRYLKLSGAALPCRASRSVCHRANILFTREDEKDQDDVEENPGIELVRGKRFTKEEDQIIKDAVHKYIESRNSFRVLCALVDDVALFISS